MRPADILRDQAELAARLGSPGDIVARQLDLITSVRTGQPEVSTPMSAAAARGVQLARAYVITTDMGRVLQNRWESQRLLPETTHCPTDVAPPRVSGFVTMEEPIAYREIRGRVQLIHVFTWGPGLARSPQGFNVPGWAVTMWNDTARRPDDISKLMFREGWTARWSAIGGLFLAHDQRIGPPTTPVSREQIRRSIIQYGNDPEITEQEQTNLARYVVAAWQLFAEEIPAGRAVERTEAPDRAGFRAAKRAGIETDITVLTLRREAHPVEHPGTGTPLEWRIPVAEHTRTYWLKGDDGLLHPEKRKIALHWRGPEDAPQRITRKVERLSR